LTVSLFLSIVSPYLVSYSSGIKYFMSQGLENATRSKKILLALFLFPFGIFYFVFLDFFVLFVYFYGLKLTVIDRIKDSNWRKHQLDETSRIGLDLMAYEGFKTQKSIAQLMFESIPQAILQSLLIFGAVPLEALAAGPVSNRHHPYDKNTVIFSITSAACNIAFQFIRLYCESSAAIENMIQYALHCFMARIGWVPFKQIVSRIHEQEKNILQDGTKRKTTNYNNKWKK